MVRAWFIVSKMRICHRGTLCFLSVAPAPHTHSHNFCACTCECVFVCICVYTYVSATPPPVDRIPVPGSSAEREYTSTFGVEQNTSQPAHVRSDTTRRVRIYLYSWVYVRVCVFAYLFPTCGRWCPVCALHTHTHIDIYSQSNTRGRPRTHTVRSTIYSNGNLAISSWYNWVINFHTKIINDVCSKSSSSSRTKICAVCAI